MAALPVTEMPSNAGFSSASASWSYNFTCGAGSTLLLVGVETNSNSAQTTDVTSVSYNGVGMTLVPNGSAPFATTSCRLKFYYLLNPPTGSSLAVAIVWTTTGGTSDCISGAITFSGNDAVTPFRSTTFTANGNSTGPATVDLTGTKVGNICVDLAGVGVTGGFSGRTNTLSWVLAVSGSTAGDNAESTRAAGNGGTVTVSHTLPSADSWGVLAIEVQAAVAGGGIAIGRGPSRSPRNIVHGPGSLFRRSTWASTEVANSSVALAGVLTGQATVAGDLKLAVALAGTLSGQAGVAGDLRESIALSGALTGQAAVAADLREAIALQGALTGHAAVAGDLRLAIALLGALSGQGAAAAALTEAILLSGALTGQANVLGDLSVSSGTPLAGVIAGQGNITGTLTLTVALAGALAGQSTVAGDLTEAVALQGAVAGHAVVAANLTEAIALAGALSGQGTVTATMLETVQLQGAISGQAILAGRLSVGGGTTIIYYPIFIFDD